jgi:hypothetical protein
MIEKDLQTFANHARFDPLFHVIVIPVFFLTAIAATVHFIWRPSWHSASFFVISVAAAIAVLKIRLYALKVQDRVIRLEERLRLATLLPEPYTPPHSRVNRGPAHSPPFRIGRGGAQARRPSALRKVVPSGYQESDPGLATGLFPGLKAGCI